MSPLMEDLARAGEARNGWLNLSEAAAFTPLAYQSFYKRVVMKREIPATRPGNTGHWFVHRDDLAAWLNAGTPEESTEAVDALA